MSSSAQIKQKIHANHLYTRMSLILLDVKIFIGRVRSGDQRPRASQGHIRASICAHGCAQKLMSFASAKLGKFGRKGSRPNFCPLFCRGFQVLTRMCHSIFEILSCTNLVNGKIRVRLGIFNCCVGFPV